MKKQLTSLCIIAGCLTLAVIITIAAHKPFGKLQTVNNKGNRLVMCTNKDCGAVTEIKRKDYNEQIQAKVNERGAFGGLPLYDCPQCGRESAIPVLKCPKCEHIFKDNFIFKCPKCGFDPSNEVK
jgi:hypothetical protein